MRIKKKSQGPQSNWEIITAQPQGVGTQKDLDPHPESDSRMTHMRPVIQEDVYARKLLGKDSAMVQPQRTWQ